MGCGAFQVGSLRRAVTFMATPKLPLREIPLEVNMDIDAGRMGWRIILTDLFGAKWAEVAAMLMPCQDNPGNTGTMGRFEIYLVRPGCL